jgi:hypothetical protein
MNVSRTHEAAVAARFERECSGHKMTILHEDGLYRHLRFTAAEGYSHWFDLITWPGNLTFNGDMGTFTFARCEDMFTFFRAKSGWNHNTINPQYWAEKVRGDVELKKFSEDLFKETITDHITEVMEDDDRFPGLMEAVTEHIFDDLDGWEETARALLDGFSFTGPAPEPDPTKAFYRILPSVADKAPTFEFTDTYEWDFREYSVFYLYACHAIQWGIGQYDKAKSTTPNCLVWSNKHGCWWRPNRAGYTGDDRVAGRYTKAEADEICGRRTWDATEPPEVAIACPPLSVLASREAPKILDGLVKAETARRIAERETAGVVA